MNYTDIITIQSQQYILNDYGKESSYTEEYKVGANILQASGVIGVAAAQESTTVVMFFDVPRTPNTYRLSVGNRVVTVDGDEWEVYNVDRFTYRLENFIRITARRRE